MILLNPGPVNLSDRVRQALLHPDLCHREKEFSQLQEDIRERLLKVYNLDPQIWTAVLLTGSGTAAVEAMISSLIPENGKLLVIENGVYGERISRMAQIHDIKAIALHHSWVEAIDLDALRQYLDQNRDLTHVAIIHHETTTGRLNSIAQIATICQEYQLKILVDTVSSFGAETIDFEGWQITACAATANKCLHGVPGTSFVILRSEALVSGYQRSLYLDLNTYHQQQEKGATPFTQSVQTFYALAEALQELEDEGGQQSRYQLYCDRINLVRSGLKNIGIKPLLPDNCSSVVLNAFYLPENLIYDTFHDHLKTNGYIIYSGQGDLAPSIFRISTMGAIPQNALERLITVIFQGLS